MTVQSPRELARACARHVDDLRVQHNNIVAVLRQHGMLDHIDSMSDAHGRIALPPQLAPMAVSYRTHRRWAHDGIVYDLHPGIVAEISRIDHDRVPAGVLDHLPHRNPLLLWPDPPACVGVRGEPSQLIGAYVAGIGPGGRRMTDTDDPDRVGYKLHLITNSEYGLSEAGANLVTTDGWYHPDTVVKTAATRATEMGQSIAQASGHDRAHTYQEHADALRSRLMPVLDALLYVCSMHADVQPAPTRVTKGSSRKTTRRAAAHPTVEFQVGWQLGPSLIEPNHAGSARHDGSDVETGGTIRPHPRRSHYGVRWTGPGRTVPRVTLVRGSYVNRHHLDGDPVPTILT